MRFPGGVVWEGIPDRQSLQVIVHEVDKEIQEATDKVLRADPPAKGSALQFLYSDKVDPTSVEFETEPKFSGDPMTMVASINRTLHEELRGAHRIVVLA